MHGDAPVPVDLLSRTTFVVIRCPQAYNLSIDTGLAEVVARISQHERFGGRLKRTWNSVRWSRGGP